MSHITLVSVTTEANVPISTATEAGSIQVLFCRAITNTLSAGGSDAISTAVAAHGCANGPNSSIKANTISGWIRSLTAITPGTSQGTRSNGRNATVTPSTNSAVGAAAFCRNNSVLSIATGRLEMQRGGQRAGAGRHDQRVQHDLPRRNAERMQQRRMLAIGQRDQQRHDRKQENAVAAEDQRGRRRRLGAEHGQRQTRAHIADIAVGAGEARHGGLAQRQVADDPAGDHGEHEGRRWFRAWSRSGMAGC